MKIKNMFKLFSKKFWFHFYLPSEMYHFIQSIDNDSVICFLKKDNISFFKLSIYKISKKLIYISISFKEEVELNQFKVYISKFKELFPPWEVFPNMFKGYPKWNQGAEEDYGAKTWLPYWRNLSEKEKEEHLVKFNCPIEWREWLETNVC